VLCFWWRIGQADAEKGVVPIGSNGKLVVNQLFEDIHRLFRAVAFGVDGTLEDGDTLTAGGGFSVFRIPSHALVSCISSLFPPIAANIHHRQYPLVTSARCKRWQPLVFLATIVFVLRPATCSVHLLSRLFGRHACVCPGKLSTTVGLAWLSIVSNEKLSCSCTATRRLVWVNGCQP
jgi:hypothetical protein